MPNLEPTLADSPIELLAQLGDGTRLAHRGRSGLIGEGLAAPLAHDGGQLVAQAVVAGAVLS
jgi:hypothetical protein